MRNNNVLGIIFCNTNDDRLVELTPRRTMGSVPFGCRYRLVDFSLSNMVNAGISKVGLITKRNYQSLADHVRNGRPWDLARKNGGLFILSPFMYAQSGMYKGKIDALFDARNFFYHSNEEYVLITNSNIVTSFDHEKMIDNHIYSGADITVAYKENINGDYLITTKENRVISFVETQKTQGGKTYLEILILKKELLMSLLEEASKHNYTNLIEDILNANTKTLNINAFEVQENVFIINSMKSYFDTNMALLDKSVRHDLFGIRSVYTKLRDNMPTRYGLHSKVSDSLIADGCVIEGEVKNSIISRGVVIGKGAKVENCIIMQSCIISENTNLKYVVADKNVNFKEGRTLMGASTFPMVIGKDLTV